ncbi:MAG TPA: hypothetical protein VK426_11605 [Methanobacterium sp.]|nr:hypothetical protein [Methanobacterium sp.]
MKISTKYLAVMLLLSIVIFASGCVNNNVNNTNNSSQNTSSPPMNTTNNSSAGSNITVLVSYQGTWNGTISDSSGNQTVEGDGNGRFNLGNQSSVSVNFQKLGNDSLQMEVDVLNGTNIIERQTTTSPQGNITISKNF